MTDEVVVCHAYEVGEKHFSKPGNVLLSGKVFEVGNYPDRGFAIDEGEMDQAICAFSPVANDLEHSRLKDVLGNSLGELRRLWRVGKEVFGELEVPKWLLDLAGRTLKVSLAFDKNKRVVGNALTLHPRIADAEVIEAFSVRERSGAKAMPTFLDRLISLFGRHEQQDVSSSSKENALAMASAFAEAAVHAKKFLPVDRPYLEKAFQAAIIVDSGASFSEGRAVEGECCQALRDMVEQRPAHELANELLGGLDTFHVAVGDGVSAERIDELLGKSDLGRAAKQAKTNKAR